MQKKISETEKFIHLFSIYEKGLINYHPCFQSSDFSVEYIIKKKSFPHQYHIQIVLSICRRFKIGLLVNDTRSVKQLIVDYSNYFSITDVRILRLMKKKNHTEESKSIKKPIVERIYFEYLNEQ
jgi:hypothetical protein